MHVLVKCEPREDQRTDQHGPGGHESVERADQELNRLGLDCARRESDVAEGEAGRNCTSSQRLITPIASLGPSSVIHGLVPFKDRHKDKSYKSKTKSETLTD